LIIVHRCPGCHQLICDSELPKRLDDQDPARPARVAVRPIGVEMCVPLQEGRARRRNRRLRQDVERRRHDGQAAPLLEQECGKRRLLIRCGTQLLQLRERVSIPVRSRHLGVPLLLALG